MILPKQMILLTVLAAGFIVGGYTAWLIKDNQILELEKRYADEAKQHTNLTNARLASMQADQELLKKHLAEMEAVHYEELTDVQKTNDQLAADLRDAKRGLSVRTTARACPSAVSDTGTDPSVDAQDVRADIHPEDAAAIVRLTAEADECAVTLTALQKRVTEPH